MHRKTILDFSDTEARAFFMEEENYISFDLPNYFYFTDVLKTASQILKKERKLSNCFRILGGNDTCECKTKLGTSTETGNLHTEKQPAGEESFSSNSCQNNILYEVSVKKRDFKYDHPKHHKDTSYTLFANKDGKYAWRALKIIHPILYVDLVNTITSPKQWKKLTERLKFLKQNTKFIQSTGMPTKKSGNFQSRTADQILIWWKDFVEKSLSLTLEYNCLFLTDISNCYDSLYTHSITWALCGKEEMKKRVQNNGKKNVEGADNNMPLANAIDTALTSMSYGETNGIPQGPAIMDFIAEIVLTYIDFELEKSLNKTGISDYKILRFRDDYRIFTKSSSVGHTILKELSKLLSEFGFRLNPNKTKKADNLVLNCIKQEKLDLNATLLGSFIKSSKTKTLSEASAQDILLQIYDYSEKHVNAGQLKRLLTSYYKKIYNTSDRKLASPIISILINLIYNNPLIAPQAIAILSVYLEDLSQAEQKHFLRQATAKLADLPNSDFLNIWLQRISYLNLSFAKSKTDICKSIHNGKVKLWDSSWLRDDLREEFEKCRFFDYHIRKTNSCKINQEEFDCFKWQYNDFSTT